MAIILALLLTQIQFIAKVIEAKQYGQTYGDILLEEDDNIYQNSFDNRGNRFEPRNTQRMGNIYQQPVATYGGKYQQEFSGTSSGRRRGEREKTQYQNQNIETGYYNRNNQNFGRNNLNGWMAASNIVEDQQSPNLTSEVIQESRDHKCHIWVP